MARRKKSTAPAGEPLDNTSNPKQVLHPPTPTNPTTPTVSSLSSTQKNDLSLADCETSPSPSSPSTPHTKIVTNSAVGTDENGVGGKGLQNGAGKHEQSAGTQIMGCEENQEVVAAPSPETHCRNNRSLESREYSTSEAGGEGLHPILAPTPIESAPRTASATSLDVTSPLRIEPNAHPPSPPLEPQQIHPPALDMPFLIPDENDALFRAYPLDENFDINFDFATLEWVEMGGVLGSVEELLAEGNCMMACVIRGLHNIYGEEDFSSFPTRDECRQWRRVVADTWADGVLQPGPFLEAMKDDVLRDLRAVDRVDGRGNVVHMDGDLDAISIAPLLSIYWDVRIHVYGWIDNGDEPASFIRQDLSHVNVQADLPIVSMLYDGAYHFKSLQFLDLEDEPVEQGGFIGRDHGDDTELLGGLHGAGGKERGASQDDFIYRGVRLPAHDESTARTSPAWPKATDNVDGTRYDVEGERKEFKKIIDGRSHQASESAFLGDSEHYAESRSQGSVEASEWEVWNDFTHERAAAQALVAENAVQELFDFNLVDTAGLVAEEVAEGRKLIPSSPPAALSQNFVQSPMLDAERSPSAPPPTIDLLIPPVSALDKVHPSDSAGFITSGYSDPSPPPLDLPVRSHAGVALGFADDWAGFEDGTRVQDEIARYTETWCQTEKARANRATRPHWTTCGPVVIAAITRELAKEKNTLHQMRTLAAYSASIVQHLSNSRDATPDAQNRTISGEAGRLQSQCFHSFPPLLVDASCVGKDSIDALSTSSTSVVKSISRNMIIELEQFARADTAGAHARTTSELSRSTAKTGITGPYSFRLNPIAPIRTRSGHGGLGSALLSRALGKRAGRATGSLSPLCYDESSSHPSSGVVAGTSRLGLTRRASQDLEDRKRKRSLSAGSTETVSPSTWTSTALEPLREEVLTASSASARADPDPEQEQTGASKSSRTTKEKQLKKRVRKRR